jgi:hypothetical protein
MRFLEIPLGVKRGEEVECCIVSQSLKAEMRRVIKF